ncbi:Threonine aldolase [Roseobacter sp. SK209-2-6]|uniref:low-specificity L-threonine aldolase n=1 Tax=Roseobacter sp. SK209-2-6 TaxID=388739 RepID=UPI0000F3CD0C|nr:Threonine aldolase [Roseobacter sp. SK209-2-6]
MNQYAGMTGSAGRNTPLCDLRSDTVTRPDAGMQAAMAAAELGDDVYGEDPCVNRLERSLAERLGKEAGLFLPTGTMSNLAGLLAHCQRGEEILVGRNYHVYRYEAAGASVLGGIALCPLAVGATGGLDPTEIASEVKPDDSHLAVSRLLSLENTHNGMAVSLAETSGAAKTARRHGLAVHLDGARFFNAVAALGCDELALAGIPDTISICLSKGLGAPAGSVLVGPADLIARARRWRKMLGGGMRQSGVLAAAGLYALEHNVQALSDDHCRAERLAEVLHSLGVGVVQQASNMVFFTPPEGTHRDLRAALASEGVIIGGADSGAIRLVLHRDISDDALEVAIDGIGRFFSN